MTDQSGTHGGRPPASAFSKLLLTEVKLTWRQPVGVILGLGLPVLLLVVFGSIPQFRKATPETGGLTLLSLYVPILNLFSLAMLPLAGLSMPIATYRELGVLRRMSTTPAPPSWLLAAQLLINVAVAAVALAIINLGGRALGVAPPQEVGGFVLSTILAAGALFAIGLWIAAIARTGLAANAIGQGLFYPMMFFGGLYFPREVMPDILVRISDWTPVGAAVQALQSAMVGSFPAARPLLVMTGYALLFGTMAVKQFKWE